MIVGRYKFCGFFTRKLRECKRRQVFWLVPESTPSHRQSDSGQRATLHKKGTYSYGDSSWLSQDSLLIRLHKKRMTGTFRLDKSSTNFTHLPVPETKVINILFTSRSGPVSEPSLTPCPASIFIMRVSIKKNRKVTSRVRRYEKRRVEKLICGSFLPHRFGEKMSWPVEKIVSLTDYQPLCVKLYTLDLCGKID